MPLYMCSCVHGVLPEETKAKIAADITDAHCDITGTSRTFVHVFFFEDAPRLPIDGKSVFIFGNIPTGHTAQQKTDLVKRMKATVFIHAGVPLGEIVADITDVPAS